jgi:hypothetical protein
MPALHQEIEMKYDVDETFEVPSLLSLGAAYIEGVPAVQSDPVTQSLEATYFDTADHRLAGARLTLRRRTGGDDEGWHLKLPGAGGDRHEVRLPLGRSRITVPVELRRLVRALTGDRPLLPVATLSTERTVRKLLDATGQVLVEVADDRVRAKRWLAAATASPPGRSSGVSWRSSCTPGVASCSTRWTSSCDSRGCGSPTQSQSCTGAGRRRRARCCRRRSEGRRGGCP